jgi:hypothetical protein
VAADRRDYYSARYWWLREVAAVTRAWLDLNLLHPTPVLGECAALTGRRLRVYHTVDSFVFKTSW